MKRNNYIKALGLSLVLAIGISGCNDDFLDSTPNDQITLENYFQNNAELQAATAPLYSKVWFDFNDKFYYVLGDGRGNNLFAPYSDYIYPFTNFRETSLTGPMVSAWAAFYNVVGQSNNTINNIRNFAVNVTEDQKNPAIAEARFMRGVAYWYLASLWGDVILRSEEHTSELQSRPHLVCRLLLEKKNTLH